MNHKTKDTSISPEALALLVSLVLLGGKLGYEMMQVCAFLEVPFREIGLQPQLSMVLRGVLRPVFWFHLIFTFSLTYLPVYAMTESLSMVSPGTDLTGGSIAQTELDKD